MFQNGRAKLYDLDRADGIHVVRTVDAIEDVLTPNYLLGAGDIRKDDLIFVLPMAGMEEDADKAFDFLLCTDAEEHSDTVNGRVVVESLIDRIIDQKLAKRFGADLPSGPAKPSRSKMPATKDNGAAA